MRNPAPQQKNSSYEQSINDASLAIMNKAYAKAAKILEKAISKRPMNTQGYHLLAYAYEHMGDIPKAMDVIANYPGQEKNANYSLYAGELLLKNGYWDRAIAAFEESLGLQPTNNNARLGLVQAHLCKGDTVAVFMALSDLRKERELSLGEKTVLMDCYTKVDFYGNFRSVLEDIHDLIADERLDKRRLGYRVGELFAQDYSLVSNPLADLSHPIVTDSLFLSFLKKIPLIHAEIDKLLTFVRRLLVLDIAQHGRVTDDQLSLCFAIAKNNHVNEYIHYVTQNEEQIVGMFEALLANELSNPQWQPAQSDALFAVLLMYKSLSQLPVPDEFLKNKYVWNESLYSFIETQYNEPNEEIQLGLQTPSLTSMSDATPESVRAMYEENPYPRWQECNRQAVGSLGHYIRQAIPALIVSECFFNDQMNILIAGCGTGKQAIEAAFLYPQAKITAFDISRRSLGYAQRMAKKLGVTNIRFFHGDILALTPSIGSFDLIECCGVLHHLVDPLDGWKKLTGLLSGTGILRVDVYSKIGRAEIIQRREQIAALSLDSSVSSMRSFRNAVINQGTDAYLLKLRDFYVISEFRDLLFHPQEMQYDIPLISKTLDELQLRFVGMHTDNKNYQLLQATLPSANTVQLSAWQQLEELHPILFSGMYSFWCQKSTVN